MTRSVTGGMDGFAPFLHHFHKSTNYAGGWSWCWRSGLWKVRHLETQKQAQSDQKHHVCQFLVFARFHPASGKRLLFRRDIKTSVRCRDRLTVLSWIPCRIWSSRASRPVVEGGALLFCSTFFSWVPPLICSSSADFPPGLGE